MTESQENFFKRNWKTILVISAIVIGLALLIYFGRSSKVSPDIIYFPT